MREWQIDIAVDLMGSTARRRAPGILALRPAPIQVYYLGFPGTSGADFIDYMIADEIVFPRSINRTISEKIVYLPDTYQCNDSEARDRGGNAEPPAPRAGLPDRASCFAGSTTITRSRPEVFHVWMRILDQADDSVLWLLRYQILRPNAICGARPRTGGVSGRG